MTSVALVMFERVLRITPLGLRCIDEVYGQTLSGLLVTATLLDGPARTVQAQLGRGCSGIYAFHDLPGVDALYEDEAIDLATLDIDQLWQMVPKLSYRIQVRDPQARYLPLSFTVQAPRRWKAGLPLPVLDVIPLVSAPTRSVPQGQGGMRLDFGLDGRFAQIKVTSPGLAQPVWGMADGRGQALVVLPYPEPDLAPLPPQPGTRQRHWTMGVRVHPYHPQGDVPDLLNLRAARHGVAVNVQTSLGVKVTELVLRESEQQPYLRGGIRPGQLVFT